MSDKEFSTVGVFLDRDGTILAEANYLDSLDRVFLIPGAAAAIGRLNDLGVRVVLVSNQSGVGRGLFTREFVEETHALLARMLAGEGARLDRVFFCPHVPEDHCHCRKPEPGMLEQARDELGIRLSRSFVVGDKTEDIMLGKRVSAQTVLVLTGHGVESREKLDARPDHVARHLEDAVDWIIRALRVGDHL